MLNKQVLELYEQLDQPNASGTKVKDIFTAYEYTDVEVHTVKGEVGQTDYVKITIPGEHGKINGGSAPTLGIVGRLGGLGARPEIKGFVSDGDGALAALAAGLKLADMHNKGDVLAGDVIVCTHIDPNAPTRPHDPVPFMSSSIDQATKNEYEVDEQMDAILSIDTTKGNRILNHTGIAITPTIKEGYILRVSEDLLDVVQHTTGELPNVLPIATQDITPYGNGVHHLNSILQPSVATTVPVVGVAITTSVMVPGSNTGASRLADVEEAARFSVETAKLFGDRKIRFYNHEEYEKLTSLYGSLQKLQTMGVGHKSQLND